MTIGIRPLTRRQLEILELIERSPIPPTVREICNHFGFKSPNTVQCALRSMERKGAITKEPYERRSVQSTRSQNERRQAGKVILPVRGIVGPTGRVHWSSSPAGA